MTTKKPAKPGRSRGYIMIESVISGALLAVALGTTVTLIGSYRREVTVAARRAEASSIAIGTADELMSRPHSTGSQGFTAEPLHRGFRTAWTITQVSPASLASTPPLPNSDAIHLIQVTVEYPGSNGTKTLVYERLKRRF